MENKENYLEFISPEKYRNQLDIWYRANNVDHKKTELFFDFVKSLHILIDNTYLGPDVIETQEQETGHFQWCWDKTIENFGKEKIFFKERGNHYDYFLSLFLEAYYLQVMNGGSSKIFEYFYKLFDFNYKKSRSELDMLAEIYVLLNNNLKK